MQSLGSALQYLHHGLGPNSPSPIISCPLPWSRDKYSSKTPDYDIAAYLEEKWPPILYRDIKPANILLRTSSSTQHGFPRVVLADFGCAYRQDDLDFEDVEDVIGTLNFMSPEIPVHSARGEIWALGAVAFALGRLIDFGPIGEPPDTWKEGSETWYSSKAARRGLDKVEVGSQYSRFLNDIISLCLAEKKKDRPLAFRLLFQLERGGELARDEGYLKIKELPDWTRD